jgi:CubicO group peptidase (beta-lactamase class C family)
MRHMWKSSNGIIICALAAAACTAGAAYVAFAQGPGGGETRPQAVQAISQVFRGFLASNNIAEASLWVGRNGSAQLAAGNLGRVPDTVAPLATGSMSITGLCILQLLDSARLDRGATIQVLLPEFTATLDEPFRSINAASIRVEHLIQHTSGITFDATKDAAIFAAAAGSPRPDEAFARAALNQQLGGPGTTYALNNVNYAILGMIIKRITAEPYEAFCTRTVLTPRNVTARIAPGLQALEAFGGWEMSASSYAQFFFASYAPSALTSGAAQFFMNSLPTRPFMFSTRVNCETCNYGLGVMVMPVGEPRSGPTRRHDIFHHGDWSSTATTPREASFFAATYTNGMTVVLNYDRSVRSEALQESMRIAAYGADPPTAGGMERPASTEEQIRNILRK